MSAVRAAPAKPIGRQSPQPETAAAGKRGVAQPPGEVNGPRGPEPTRYGDWEKGGRCSDF